MLPISCFIQLGARAGVDSSSSESLLRLLVRVLYEYRWLEPEPEGLSRRSGLIEYLSGERAGLPLPDVSFFSFFARRERERESDFACFLTLLTASAGIGVTGVIRTVVGKWPKIGLRGTEAHAGIGMGKR